MCQGNTIFVCLLVLLIDIMTFILYVHDTSFVHGAVMYACFSNKHYLEWGWGYGYTIKGQATHIMITFTTIYHLEIAWPNLNLPLALTDSICFSATLSACFRYVYCVSPLVVGLFRLVLVRLPDPSGAYFDVKVSVALR